MPTSTFDLSVSPKALMVLLAARETVKKDPDSVFTWIVLARISAAAGDLDEAAAAWGEVAARDYALAKSAHFEQARLLGQAGRGLEACQAMEASARMCDFITDQNLAEAERERMQRLHEKLRPEEATA